VKDINRSDDIVPRTNIIGKAMVIEGVCSVSAKEMELSPSVIIKHIKFEEIEKKFSISHSQNIPT
jgi:hypothetical protein